MSRIFAKTKATTSKKSALIKATAKTKKVEWTAFDWQKEVLDIGKGKNVVVCAGRQCGKTELALHKAWTELEAKPDRTIWWVSPTLRQCRRDIFPRFLRMTKGHHESATITDLTIYFPNGSRIIFLSGEKQHADHLLGATLDLVILDECARLDRTIWEQYIQPMLVVKGANVWMISTPLGRNWFFEAYNWGQDEEMGEWVSFHTPSIASPMITEEALENIRAKIPLATFEQEYLAQFTDSVGGAFYGIAGCEENYETPVPFDKAETYIIGVDLARKKDWTVILVIDSTGRVCYMDRCQDVAFAQQKHRVHHAIDKYGGGMEVLVDATGMGAKFVEDLYNDGVRVEGITLDFRTKAEIIQHLAFQVETGGVIYPQGGILVEELSAYEMNRSDTGVIRYKAGVGFHDDTVIALALSVWGMRHEQGEGIWVF